MHLYECNIKLGEILMTITFFGHRNTPISIKPLIKEILIDFIENQNAIKFYVGNNGSFDFIVRKTLKELKAVYQNIDYAVVLAYINNKPNEYDNYSDTIIPDGIEKVPPRFAICWRNEWMINNSDTVITFVEHNIGGAAKYESIALKKGKKVINIADYYNSNKSHKTTE